MKLRNSVFVAIFATALITTILLLFLQQIRFSYAFNEYISKNRIERIDKFKARLTERFAETGSWEFITRDVDTDTIRSQKINRKTVEPSDKWWFMLDFPRGIALLNANKKALVGDPEPNMTLTTIYHKNKPVGFLGVKDNNELKAELDNHFIKQQAKSLVVITILTLLLASLSAFFLSRKLTKPISDIAGVVNRLRQGDFTVNSHYKHSNELGQLSSDINFLANTLRENRESRQRWIADISHELRTPITIILGELECLEDGLTPFDNAAIMSLKEEITGLNKLVADLHQLSLADQGEMRLDIETVDITQLMETCFEKYQPVFNKNTITTHNQLPSNLFVKGDTTRLQQVFVNLFENCARYTEKGGEVRLSANQDVRFVSLVVENTARDIPEKSLTRMFDRLYRVDKSRNKFSGGSGLGLAICAAIIDAHGGKIYAKRSSLNGLAITVSLPVNSVKGTQE